MRAVKTKTKNTVIAFFALVFAAAVFLNYLN